MLTPVAQDHPPQELVRKWHTEYQSRGWTVASLSELGRNNSTINTITHITETQKHCKMIDGEGDLISYCSIRLSSDCIEPVQKRELLRLLGAISGNEIHEVEGLRVTIVKQGEQIHQHSDKHLTGIFRFSQQEPAQWSLEVKEADLWTPVQTSVNSLTVIRAGIEHRLLPLEASAMNTDRRRFIVEAR